MENRMFDKTMTIADFDDQLAGAIAAEERRQEEHIELIASENYCSPRVMEAQGTALTNKYAEGYSGRRYYGGCEFVDQAEDLGHALARLQVGEDEGPARPLGARVTLHDREVGADMGREVGLVDDEDVGAGDRGPALAGDLLSGGDVDHVDRHVGEFRREGGREVVAPRFHQHEVEPREPRVELRDGVEVDRGVLADRRVRAAPGLDPHDPVGRQRLHPHQCQGIAAIKCGVGAGVMIIFQIAQIMFARQS